VELKIEKRGIKIGVCGIEFINVELCGIDIYYDVE
jgi:hypothetical protein